MGGKEEVGRCCFEQKSIREKPEFREVIVSHWLSLFLVGDAMHIFSTEVCNLCFPVDDSSSVIDNSSCN